MCIGGLSVWWWLKVVINLLLVSYAVYSGIFLEGVWLEGTWLLMGQMVVLIGTAINLTHFLLLRQAARDIKAPDALLTEMGFFQVIRHPMYLGEMIVVLGVVGLSFNWVSFGLFWISVFAMMRLCLVEDGEMETRFGEQHALWRKNTKAMFPGIW